MGEHVKSVNYKGAYSDCRKTSWISCMHNNVHVPIYVLHERWLRLAIQRWTHITLCAPIFISVWLLTYVNWHVSRWCLIEIFRNLLLTCARG